MSKLALALVFLLGSNLASATEIDLANVGDTINGFCVQDVITVAGFKTKTKAFTAEEKNLIGQAEKRAKAIYLASTLSYVEGAKEEDLNVSSKIKLAPEGVAAVIVEVNQGGDEDLVTFHFVRYDSSNEELNDELALKMALHWEQSAQAIWVCE